MDELTIRRNRSFAVPQRQGTGKVAKQSAAGEAQKVEKGTGLAVSETLRQRMDQTGRAGESRRTLQLGEGVLAEVQEKLARMAELAKEAAGEGADREAIQAELEKLVREIDRMTGSAVAGDLPLFSEGDAAAAMALPDWLVKAAVQGGMTADRLLEGLGLDRNATGAEILGAIVNSSLEGNAATGYLAALYLGAVIAKGTGDLDPTKALDGFRQLLERAMEGVPLDKAIEELTGGEFTSLADFQEQFLGGGIPGMEAFLAKLLLSEAAAPAGVDLWALLEGGGGMDLELMLALLSAGQVVQQPAVEEAATAGGAALPEAASPDGPPDGSPGAVSEAASAPAAASQPVQTTQCGAVRVMGRDLSGVTYDPATGTLTVGGPADVFLQGTGSSAQTIQLTGSGAVTLQDVRAAVLSASAPEARVFTVGETVLERVELRAGASLTLDGRGMLRAGSVQGGGENLLRLLGGAVAVTEQGENGPAPGVLAVPVVLDGPASLAAQASNVRDLSGRALEPMDVVWKTLFPGFSAVASLTLDGRHSRMHLLESGHASLARLWLAKGDPSSHGYPAHSLVIRGRDEAGRARTRYAYLHWDRRGGMFREMAMYPNPFTVTGGEQDRDWVYEEESHTLRILTGQVAAVSGGAGMDARQEPFSGRIALTDRIGPIQLALGGVVCKVSSGRAFQLGRENAVTLLLRSGTNNLFESGAGCAGISMGEGTSLRIDCAPQGGGELAGTLTATGGEGGVGIGGDGGRGCSGHIMIRGGMISGSKPDAGSVTIVGGGTGAGTDLGNTRTWVRMGIFLQMGEDTVILPQFPLSSRTLRLNKLRVTAREHAQVARITIDMDRRWVERMQAAYSALSNRLDFPEAAALFRGMRRTIPLQSSQAIETHSKRGTEDVGRLLR